MKKILINKDGIQEVDFTAEEITENQYSNYEGSFKNDLLGYTLNQINYNEVATAIIEDIKQDLN